MPKLRVGGILPDYWYNQNVRLKTKRYVFYHDWHALGISTLADLHRGHNFVKTFEDLVLEYDISIKDRRKYNSLMNGILIDWFYNPPQVQDIIFDRIVESLFDSVKITKSSYIIFKSQENSVNVENFWIEALDINVDDIDWASVHDNNFNSTIETQIRAFYFKIFHRAICTNQFLHKIGRSDSPLCYFCQNSIESYIHMFCECDKVRPLWDNLSAFIDKKCGENLDLSNFQKMFGMDLLCSEHTRGINFLILYLKFYIYRCRYQKCNPNFQAFLKLMQIKLKTEYKIAERKGKLSQHLKKFTFDFDEN